MEFVPVRVLYKGEQSKISPLRDTLRWLRWWARATTVRGVSSDLPLRGAFLRLHQDPGAPIEPHLRSRNSGAFRQIP